MNKQFSTGLVFGILLLLFAANAWSTPMSLPSIGDKVQMTVGGGDNYGMKIIQLATGSSSIVNDTYNAFCVEINEHFSNGGSYWVESVGIVATGGGGGAFSQTAGIWDGKSGDPISAESIWLYASFFDGLFGDIDEALVQNAIWFMEEEIPDSTDWNILKEFSKKNDVYTYIVDTGWNIQVVNLISYNNNGATINNQSQLVGVRVPIPTAHAPEPATMILFGIGLLVIAGFSRKNLMK